jgi:hypothetical protein
MGYENIPSVTAELPDGNLRTSMTSSQPRILILGAAASGITYELYQVTNVGAAETEFGKTSEIIKKMHEVINQNADNVALMRIGGQQGVCRLTTASGGTVTFYTLYRDEDILDRYSLVITNDATTNRYLVWDNEDNEWVFDTNEIKVIDDGIIRIVESGTVDIMTVGDIDAPDTAADSPTLGGTDVIIAGDDSEGNLATVATVDGTDGTSMSMIQRYAALNTAYQVMDFRDADYVIPCAIHLDDVNIVDSGSATEQSLFCSPAVTDTSANDQLWYVWQYIYRGKLYTYFVESADFFTQYATAAASVGTATSTTLTYTAVKKSAEGDAITVQHIQAASTSVTTTVSETGVAIVLNIDIVGGATQADAIQAVNADLNASKWVTAATSAGAVVLIAEVVTCAAGAGESFTTHAELTGDAEPAGVLTKFVAGADAEIREVNFVHQLGSFCYTASTNWKSMIGFVTTKPPSAFDRYTVATWVGETPTYTDNGTIEYIDSSADNGTGLLGIKFMAGKAGAASDGYRDGLVTDGDANDSYAYGGFILTDGASLPNELPYGINDSDEATDVNGEPVDLGKHLFVTYDYWVHNNSYNGGTRYRGSIEGMVAGKYAVTDVRREPIGPSNGLITGGSRPCHIKYPQMNDLAGLRMIGLRREDNVGYILVSAHTAANPDSDYTKLSTIRSVNRTLNNVRTICKRYLGEAFTASVLASLNQQIEAYLLSDKQEGYNNGAVHSLSYDNTDRILGRLTVYVKMVPPGSIESINVSLSLAASESDL